MDQSFHTQNPIRGLQVKDRGDLFFQKAGAELAGMDPCASQVLPLPRIPLPTVHSQPHPFPGKIRSPSALPLAQRQLLPLQEIQELFPDSHSKPR